MRDRFEERECYDYTAEFCHTYDQLAFDSDLKSTPLEEFIPLVEKFFFEPQRSLYMADE